jgi:hypothetical protein
MKNITFLILGICTLAITASAVPYSIDATITPQKNKGQYQVVVHVSKLIEQNGKLIEKLICTPKVTSGFGGAASLYQGLTPNNPDYLNQENVSVDVFYPKSGNSDFASCVVTVKRGDEVVAKSNLRLKIGE